MNRDGLKTVAGLSYFVSLVLVGVGFYVMFTYGDYDDTFETGSRMGHIVGGDAYNFIIIAVRGLGFIVTGLISAVVGGVASILARLEYERETALESLGTLSRQLAASKQD